MARLFGFDYKRPFFYMVTLKKARGVKAFSEIGPEGLVKSGLTRRFEQTIREFYGKWRCVDPDQPFIVMPDHLHWLLRIRKQLPHPLSFYMFRFMEETAKELGDVWERSFNDGIIFNSASLKYRLQYLKDNPHRLCERLAHPEMFVRLNDLKHPRLPEETPLPWTGYGNRFLLDCPDLIPVQVSRRVTSEQMEEWHERVREICQLPNG